MTIDTKFLDPFGIPNQDYFSALFAENASPSLSETMMAALIQPATELTKRPGKSIRAQLVALGFSAYEDANVAYEEHIKRCQQAIELLHNGSLIIDDIQDNSLQRRGGPPVHQMFGINKSITSGNWLYFWPLRLLSSLPLDNQAKLALFEAYHRTVEMAHYGQSLDIAATPKQLRQEDVAGYCEHAIRMKTGCLTSFALQLGALITNQTEERTKDIASIGEALGVVLQYFDDIGNVQKPPSEKKQFEDIRNGAPTFLWISAAKHFSESDYRHFQEIMSGNINNEGIANYFQTSPLIGLAKRDAQTVWQTLCDEITDNIDITTFFKHKLIDLGETLSHVFSQAN